MSSNNDENEIMNIEFITRIIPTNPLSFLYSDNREIIQSSSRENVIRIIDNMFEASFFLNIVQNLFNVREVDDYDREMEYAMQESLEYYKTQEKKPNIRLNVKSIHATNKHEEENCSICKSEFLKGEELTKLDCKHLLHTECIGTWVKYKAECPVCRVKIDVIDENDKKSEK